MEIPASGEIRENAAKAFRGSGLPLACFLESKEREERRKEKKWGRKERT